MWYFLCYALMFIIVHLISDIDECTSSPCVQGDCTNKENHYTCLCENGWVGDNCDEGQSTAAVHPMFQPGTNFRRQIMTSTVDPECKNMYSALQNQKEVCAYL